MNHDEQPDLKSPREKEIERLSKFPTAPYVPRPSQRGARNFGVLLSDEIAFYCDTYKLVDPCKPANIMAASYELRVGFKYSVSGEPGGLKLGDKLRIRRFEVAVIEILETINMPDFIVGRWNIRTRWAYEGLVWVGGPQVNPGYRGLLFCPIWNLSNKDVEIECGDAIAVMDFSYTTMPTALSNRQPPWNSRTRYVFEDYKPQLLLSGLAPLAEKIGKEVEGKLKALKDGVDSQTKAIGEQINQETKETRTRVDNFIAVTFTALGVLTTAVTFFVTKPSQMEYYWEPTVFLVSWLTLILALLAWTRNKSRRDWSWGVEIGIILIATLALVFQFSRLRNQAIELKETKEQLQLLDKKVAAVAAAKQTTVQPKANENTKTSTSPAPR